MKKSSLFILTLITIFLIFLTSCSQQKDFRSMTADEIDAMSMEEKLKAIDEEVRKNPLREMTDEEKAAEKEVMEFMSDGSVLKSGSFQGKAHPTLGSVQITEKDGQVLVTLSEDFKSDAGPQLRVVLTENSNPKNSRELHTGDYVDLGALKSTKGTQSYSISKDKVGNLNSVVIYCKPFRVIFGLASLN